MTDLKSTPASEPYCPCGCGLKMGTRTKQVPDITRSHEQPAKPLDWRKVVPCRHCGLPYSKHEAEGDCPDMVGITCFTAEQPAPTQPSANWEYVRPDHKEVLVGNKAWPSASSDDPVVLNCKHEHVGEAGVCTNCCERVKSASASGARDWQRELEDAMAWLQKMQIENVTLPQSVDADKSNYQRSHYVAWIIAKYAAQQVADLAFQTKARIMDAEDNHVNFITWRKSHYDPIVAANEKLHKQMAEAIARMEHEAALVAKAQKDEVERLKGELEASREDFERNMIIKDCSQCHGQVNIIDSESGGLPAKCHCYQVRCDELRKRSKAAEAHNVELKKALEQYRDHPLESVASGIARAALQSPSPAQEPSRDPMLISADEMSHIDQQEQEPE
jgi:hypothetical protein